MENFNIQATKHTPHIAGSIKEGTISISGVSCPDDCVNFFQPFINWLKLIVLSKQKHIKVEIDMHHFNTSSGLVLFRIIKDLKNLSPGRTVSVIWKYEPDDFDMKGVGRDFQYMLGDIIQLEAKVQRAS